MGASDQIGCDKQIFTSDSPGTPVSSLNISRGKAGTAASISSGVRLDQHKAQLVQGPVAAASLGPGGAGMAKQISQSRHKKE